MTIVGGQNHMKNTLLSQVITNMDTLITPAIGRFRSQGPVNFLGKDMHCSNMQAAFGFRGAGPIDRCGEFLWQYNVHNRLIHSH